MRRRILYLLNFDVSIPFSGAPLRSREIIRFISQKHDVHIINIAGCSRRPGTMEIEYRDRHSDALTHVLSRREVKFTQFGYSVFSQSLLREAQRVLAKIKFDLIFADFTTTAIYGYLLAKRFRLPWVYSSHNVEYARLFERARDDFRRYLLVPYYYFIERVGCRADLVSVISNRDAGVYSKWIRKSRLLVIPQGFDAKTFHPFYKKVQNKRPVVLFYGSYDNLANRHAVYLIYRKILPRVIAKIPDAEFQFVGAYPPQDISHPNITFTGFVDNLVDYIRSANVIIVPITSGGGVRTKIIESLACGKTVISTTRGVMGIPMKFNNLLVRNIEDFPEAICNKIYENKGVDSSEFDILKEKFSWQNILPRLNQEIEDIIYETKRSNIV